VSTAIQTLWVGESLSPMEQLCLSSFLYHGHEVHLYVYSDIAGIPTGVKIRDGREILPEDMIFLYNEHKSFSGFSNYFRYKMLFERGGYWIDTDMVCLRPFDFKQKFVFSSEEVLPLHQNNQHVNAGVIKAPKGSLPAKHAFDVCMSKEKDKLKWGEIGPRLVKQTVEMFNLQSFVQDYNTFCPIPGCLWHMFIDPQYQENFENNENVYGLHLWNEMWRRADVDKTKKFDEDCLYEKLKRKYL